ncbi:MAG TPA: hypothetical protein PLH92_05520 [Mycobacterium sp.]|nr:hypothetical protein [Mycobacterium sp.]HQC76161.1 hypothetical protein [Mycobacterium sp.]
MQSRTAIVVAALAHIEVRRFADVGIRLTPMKVPFFDAAAAATRRRPAVALRSAPEPRKARALPRLFFFSYSSVLKRRT